MDVDKLANLVLVLRARIESHRARLQQIETRTRYALIDPALSLLGWDLQDPAVVVPEYTVGGAKRADYALFGKPEPAKPSVFVEAKALDTPLEEGLEQSIFYCFNEGVRYFVVSDGRRWQVYDTQSPGDRNQKKIVEFSLSGDANAFALSALWLWRGNHATTAPTSAQRPEESVAPTPLPATVPAAIRESPLRSEGGASLATFHGQPYTGPPRGLRFPDGTSRPISRWNDLPVVLVDWLINTGKLTPAKCPIRNAGRYLVSTTPVHPNDKPFTKGKQVRDVYVEVNYSARHLVDNSRRILAHLGENPAQYVLEP